MPDRPLILFPTPEKADRNRKNPNPTKIHVPSVEQQFSRLRPVFHVLQEAFDRKTIRIQEFPLGMNPDFALVFEVIGDVNNFFTAVKNIEGLEWMFDTSSQSFEPDEEFYSVDWKTGNRIETALEGKVYCVMSNKEALSQMLSLWQRYQSGEINVFPRGYAGLRDVFTHIKNIRKWEARDRIDETHMLQYWRESLDLDKPTPFEIELFYRNDSQKRRVSSESIYREIEALSGQVLQECILEDICYHGILVELPRNAIESLVSQYEEIALSQVDDIMFFRPTCQAAFTSAIKPELVDADLESDPLPTGDALIAVFDGMPIQNHHLLQGRVIVDDPDDYASGYESKFRIHGTSMVSQAIYGDLKKKDKAIHSPVYVRPILRPSSNGLDVIDERVPDNCLLIDVLHRSVKRMFDGLRNESSVAPHVKVINLSIGDPVRQFAGTLSPIARLLDFLAYKYKILFVISAGNHEKIIDCIDSTYDDFKSCDIEKRSEIFFRAIQENQRNLKILAPAESINSLTVGALYDDYTDSNESDQCIWAVDRGLPSPLSSFGSGYLSIITPDLFYNGGRTFLRRKLENKMDWVSNSRAPGCSSAAPYEISDMDARAFSSGTSNAAAQITHEAAKCYDVLSQVFIEEMGTDVPEEFAAIFIKAMLTHGASWGSVGEKLANFMHTSPKKLCNWLGNGIPDINRVMECTKERITIIGYGELKNGEGHIFKLPLPIDFSSHLMRRKLTVTLAYFSPIVPNQQKYRGVQFWFDLDERWKRLVPQRQNTDWRAVRRGTLQHEIFEGEDAIVWNDNDFIIKVNCTNDAGKFKLGIPYCLFVSFEIAEGFGVDLYSTVKTRIHQTVQITDSVG